MATNPYLLYQSGSNSTRVGPQLDLSNAVVASLPVTLAGGTWTPTLTPSAGFTVVIPVAGPWMQVGNRISCSFTLLDVTLAAGDNLGFLSLPVPRTVAGFATAAGVANTANFSQGITVHGNTGNPATVALAGLGLTASVGDAVTGTIVYSLM